MLRKSQLVPVWLLKDMLINLPVLVGYQLTRLIITQLSDYAQRRAY